MPLRRTQHKDVNTEGQLKHKAIYFTKLVPTLSLNAPAEERSRVTKPSQLTVHLSALLIPADLHSSEMDPRGEASPRSHGHRRRHSPFRSPSPSQPIGNQAHSPRPPPAHPKDGATGGSPLGEGSPRRPPPPARSRSRKRPRSSSEPPPPPRHAPFGGGFCPAVPRPPPLRRPRRRTGRPGPSGAKGAAPSPRLPSRYFLRSRRWTLFTTPESFSCSSFRSCSGGGGGGGGEAAAPPGRGRDRGAASMAVPLLRRAQPGRGRCEPDAYGTTRVRRPPPRGMPGN